MNSSNCLERRKMNTFPSSFDATCSVLRVRLNSVLRSIHMPKSLRTLFNLVRQPQLTNNPASLGAARRRNSVWARRALRAAVLMARLNHLFVIIVALARPSEMLVYPPCTAEVRRVASLSTTTMLAASGDDDHRIASLRLLNFVQRRLELTSAEAEQVVRLRPSSVFEFSVGRDVGNGHDDRTHLCTSEAHRTLEFLETRLALTMDDLRRLVVANPLVLGYSVEATLSPSLDFLEAHLQLSTEQLRKVVVSLPPVLSLSVEANLKPKLAHLKSRLHLSTEEMRRVVVAHPKILGYR